MSKLIRVDLFVLECFIKFIFFLGLMFKFKLVNILIGLLFVFE